MNNIIIIEDDHLKQKAIRDFLKELLPGKKIDCFPSYNSGLRQLLKEKYDLLILDMSMPTFNDDYFNNEPSFEKFGGLMILKELKRKKSLLPTILFTMFDDFGSREYSISLKEIDNQLSSNYEDYYLGYVYYEPSRNLWMEEIKRIINDYNFDSR